MSDRIAEAALAKCAVDGVLTAGTDGFVGMMRPPLDQGGAIIPVKAAFFYTSDGYAPRPYIGGGKVYERDQLEVRIRSARDDYSGGALLARQIYESLEIGELDFSAYADIEFTVTEALSSKAGYVGQLDKDRWHQWRIVFLVQYERTRS